MTQKETKESIQPNLMTRLRIEELKSYFGMTTEYNGDINILYIPIIDEEKTDDSTNIEIQENPHRTDRPPSIPKD